MSTILSVSISSVMCVERYMAVVHPVVHRNKVTRKLLSKCIACIYVACVIMFGVSFVNKQAFNNFTRIVVGLYVIMIAYSEINISFVRSSFVKMGVQWKSHRQATHRQTSNNNGNFLQRKFSVLAVVCCVLCFAPAVILGHFFILSYFNK